MSRKGIGPVCLWAMMLAVAGNAAAEDKTDTGIQEVIVTATKRSEPLKEVPLSVSVMSSADLESEHVTDFMSLARAVPSIGVSSGGGPGLGYVELRGISSQAGSATTGIYLDDVPLSISGIYTSGATEPRFFDIDHVEVLRGPQGTLYGSSSMGGTLKYVSNQPDLEKFGGSVHAELSGTQGGGINYETNAVVNMPLVTDKAALRVGILSREDSGWIDRAPGPDFDVIDHGINESRDGVIRAALKVKVSDDLTVTPALFAQRVTTDGTSLFDLSLPRYESSTKVAERGKDSFYIPSLTINYDTGWSDLTSVTSYFWRQFNRMVDGTTYDSVFLGSLLQDQFGYGGDAIGALAAPSAFDTGNKQLTQEVRLTSKSTAESGSPFTWLAGLYYSFDKFHVLDDENIPGLTSTFTNTYGGTPLQFLGTPFTNDKIFYANSVFETMQYAVFGEVSYNITPALKATAGIRYLIAHESLDFVTSGYFSANLQSSSADKAYAATPKFALTYDATENATLYANASKGFRLGGGNRAIPNDVCAADLAGLGMTKAPENYNSDKLWSYEGGIKSRLLDNHLSVNLSGYDIKWDGIQEDVILNNCGFDFITNLGQADSHGAELEVTAKVTDNFTMTFGGNITSATLTQPLPQAGIDKGDNVIGVPQGSFNWSGEYRVLVADRYDSFLRLNYQWVGPSQGTIQHDTPDFHRPAYSVVGGSVGVDYDDLEISLFATNLLNNGVIIQRPNLASVYEGLTLQPRTIGLSASMKF